MRFGGGDHFAQSSEPNTNAAINLIDNLLNK